MNLLPYKRIVIETNRSFDSIRSSLDKAYAPPKKFDLQKILSGVLEYQAADNNFYVIMGGYGFFHGASNFNPVMSGKFISGNTAKNKIDIRIHLQQSGIILLLFVLAISVIGLVVSIQRSQWEGIITTALLIVIIYWGIMARFNKVAKKYMDVISQFGIKT